MMAQLPTAKLPGIDKSREVYKVELGQQGPHFVDLAFTDPHVTLPVSAATNLEVFAATAFVGGNIDFDLDIGGTILSFAGATGAIDLAIPATPIANLAVIQEQVTAVNTSGDEFILNVWVRYRPVKGA